LVGLSKAQTSTTGSESESTGNVITTAMPFLTIASDAKSAAMADLGVATEPDPFATYWNPGKLAFNEGKIGGAISVTPWLRSIGLTDMWISYLAGFYKPKDREGEAFGFHFNYFNLGEIQFTDLEGEETTEGNPSEFSVGFSYSRKLSKYGGLGIGLKYLRSDLANGIGEINGGETLKAANMLAADIGYYTSGEIFMFGKVLEASLGATISNLGGKVNYSSADNNAFIPTNLRLGAFVKNKIDSYHEIGFGIDFNKLLVPTPDTSESYNDQSVLSGVFTSFADAPGGFSEEMQEITISTAFQYVYQDAFFGRLGYFHEAKDKGNRKNITTGVGFKYGKYALDVAYLIPIQQGSPLANTIRFSLSFFP